MPRPSKLTTKKAITDEFVSKLPAYQAKRSESFPAFLIVYCGYADCPGTEADRPFLVAEKEWLEDLTINVERTGKTLAIIGRSCPYCFRTGRRPEWGEIG